MGALTPRPSAVISEFESRYEKSPLKATDYFYKLCIDSNYIRSDRIAKDLKWRVDSDYGEIDVTVNLSKPEKDPKAIALARLAPQTDYPKCALCHENEGFAGTLTKAARQNLRQIPYDMGGEKWYLQYSPYVYYNEHCIALSAEHRPMSINRDTFIKLIRFVTKFPHYFIGSNADLPIVGGSILSHDHMQGGHYSFAMERAEIGRRVEFSGYENVKAGILRWPMSVIRLVSDDVEALVELSNKILTIWRGYSDRDAFIFAETDGTPHNTITPIARRKGEEYEIDLVLRNNITTEEHPLGVFHPHEEHHNIKKENIGLIEVMGLAVLPSRLKKEIELMCEAIMNGQDFSEIPEIEKHKSWFEKFRDNYSFTPYNVEGVLRAEIGKTFVRVLSDAGVYKDTEEGRDAFLKFVDAVNKA
jgi:UDPglucose--hexose-1-phosphate uridylyltransferase